MGVMTSGKSSLNVRAKVRRALRAGRMPIDIAKKLGLPLLTIAEVALWNSSAKQDRGSAGMGR